jgi:uncharacterized membrane protein YjgN (DUF898 family)
MAFCNRCGTNLNSNASFCAVCGAPAVQQFAPTVPAAVQQPVYAPQPAYQQAPPQYGYPQAIPQSVPGQRRFVFHGNGGDMLGLYLVMFLLSSITLGIYQFWGRTKIRKYIAQCTEFNGHRFDYHGTGKELFIGWLKAVGALIGLVIVVGLFTAALVATIGDQAGPIIGVGLGYLSLFALAPFVIIGMWRYRFSRTSYRGIRFSFRGKWQDFFGLFFGGLLLSIVTLSIYSPIWLSNIRKYLCQHSYYGNARFDYDGNGSDLVGKWLIALVLALPTLYISLIWYNVESYRYFWNRTTFQGSRFRSEVTTGGFIGMAITNMLLVVFTLGIGMTWAMVRQLRYMVNSMVMEGQIDLERIHQEALQASPVGEGFAGVFDAHGVVDIGM